jgi:energy-coupling factor transporter ATP-binding protein EcfA2
MRRDSGGPPAINPFLVPGWEESPLRPLCPWRYESHDELYVDVNHTLAAFQEYTRRMAAVENLREDGRLVLVTGESGCGKTALINRCARWTRDRLTERGLRGVVVDLTRDGSRQSVEERMGLVAARLLDELAHSALLAPEALASLDSVRPSRLYAGLGNALPDDVVLIVLLPPADEVVQEVVAYAGLARRRLLFFAESSYLGHAQVLKVRDSSPVPPITLAVGPLNQGDVRRFIEDRLTRHHDRGHYPRISTETMDKAAGPLRSIAMLQRILSEVYEERGKQDSGYTDDDWVTYEDITRLFYEKFFDDLRIRR